MAIDASSAGHSLAELHGEYLYDSGLEPDLQGAQRIFVMLWRFQAELYNGGVWQFFTNSTGEYTPYICDALREVDAIELAETMDDAIAASRPGTAWHSAATQSVILNRAPAEVRDQVYAFDDRLNPNLDELSVKLYEYVDRHRDQFDVSEQFWEEGSRDDPR
ncbi:DMP19 family protein [Rhodopseudomonas sp. NSM]|uniref:DMP19 family protein n=1 Tax=Rhodopseudomonas sp. NSM TaxID=3457630 RepID=UPI00403725F7